MGCTHDCESCGGGCGSGEQSFTKELNELSSVKKVYAVVSGKGGVGKSTVTSMLAVTMNRRGHKTAILDADITGPSIPAMFGITAKAESVDEKLIPAKSKTGVELMSINLLLANADDPVVWRGPVISGAVGQFWTDTIWKDIDYMFVDMPPGTGDVPLTVFQSLPVDGIIVVTSPQQLVSTIVGKAVKMAELMNVPIVGVVENYSYYECKDCGKRVEIFGKSNVEQIVEKHGLPLLARLPIDPDIAKAADNGLIELFEGDALEPIADILEK